VLSTLVGHSLGSVYSGGKDCATSTLSCIDEWSKVIYGVVKISELNVQGSMSVPLFHAMNSFWLSKARISLPLVIALPTFYLS
jgi:hypothetical protein